MEVPARVRASAVLVFLIGLPVIGAEAQSGVSFTVATGPIVSNSVFSGVSLQVFPHTPFGYVRVGSAFRTPSAEFGYGIYSGSRGNHPTRYFGPRYAPCWDYIWDPFVGFFNDWLWGCDFFTGLAYRSIHHPWDRFLIWSSFHSRPPRHAFTYWRDPFIPPWGPHWTQDPWAPFWDGYWDEPGFGGHFPASYPAVPEIAKPEPGSRTATRRPSSRVGSPRGYGGGTARPPGRSAVPRNSSPPSRWPAIPVLDSQDPEEPKEKPRARGLRPPPSDFARPPSDHPSLDPRRAGGASRGATTRTPRPSDRIRGGTVPNSKTEPRVKPKSRNRSPYPSFDRNSAGGNGTFNNPSLGRRRSPKAQTRPEASPRTPQTRPALNRAPKATPSPSRAPRARATPRTSPKVSPKPPHQPSRPSSTARRARRPGN